MKKLITLGAAVLLMAGAAQAEELFVNIHSGGTMAQGAEMPKLKPRDVTPQQMLQGLIKNGATVEVCALYLPNTGLKASDLIPGVGAAKPADVAAHLLKPGMHTLAF